MPRSTNKLCIDLRWIDSSGVGVYIKGIMPEIVDRLGDVVIVGIGNRARLEEFSWSRASNVQLLNCHAGRYSIAEQIQLQRLIPRDTSLFFSPYYTIPLFYRGALAVTVHDMSHLTVQEIVGSPKKRIYAQTMYRALRKRASLILTVSDFSKKEFLRLLGGDDKNVITTHLGVSEEWYEAARMPRTYFRPYLVSVSNIKPYKNINRLVEAFLRIKDRVPHDLVLVGQSEGLITGESAEFFERVKSAGDRIHLTGFVSHDELLSLIGHAHALIMPSLYEGFGLPPLEAMAAGVPVAVSHVASLPEVCGAAALYFDPHQTSDIAEKLYQIAIDEGLCGELREKGAKQSRLYTWKSCAEKTVWELRAVLERSHDG